MGFIAQMWIKRLRTPTRCPFYLGTERIIMYELLTTVGPVAIVIAIIIWIFDDGGKKQEAKLQETVKQNYETSLRTEFKSQTRRHLRAADIKPTSDELDWMCMQLGVERLDDLITELKNEPVSNDKEQLNKDVATLKNRYRESLEWNKYLEEFKGLNKSQQDYEIKRMKKNANPDSPEDREMIRILELVRRGDAGDTDILVGGVKLFTVRKK